MPSKLCTTPPVCGTVGLCILAHSLPRWRPMQGGHSATKLATFSCPAPHPVLLHQGCSRGSTQSPSTVVLLTCHRLSGSRTCFTPGPAVSIHITHAGLRMRQGHALLCLPTTIPNLKHRTRCSITAKTRPARWLLVLFPGSPHPCGALPQASSAPAAPGLHLGTTLLLPPGRHFPCAHHMYAGMTLAGPALKDGPAL